MGLMAQSHLEHALPHQRELRCCEPPQSLLSATPLPSGSVEPAEQVGDASGPVSKDPPPVDVENGKRGRSWGQSACPGCPNVEPTSQMKADRLM